MSYSTLKRSKPMSRGKGFSSSRGSQPPVVALDREERLAQRAASLAQSAKDTAAHIASIKPRPIATAAVALECMQVCTSIPKENVVRCPAYLRLVASMPCAWCGIVGFSQAAHDNVGKGMSIKACDLRTFPMCCDRAMQRGCHSLLDQYKLVERGEAERNFVEQAIAHTQVFIATQLGWPKTAPMPIELQELLKVKGEVNV